MSFKSVKTIVPNWIDLYVWIVTNFWFSLMSFMIFFEPACPAAPVTCSVSGVTIPTLHIPPAHGHLPPPRTIPGIQSPPLYHPASVISEQLDQTTEDA